MRVIPKKTKYHFKFRNKLKTKKISKYGNRICALSLLEPTALTQRSAHESLIFPVNRRRAIESSNNDIEHQEFPVGISPLVHKVDNRKLETPIVSKLKRKIVNLKSTLWTKGHQNQKSKHVFQYENLLRTRAWIPKHTPALLSDPFDSTYTKKSKANQNQRHFSAGYCANGYLNHGYTGKLLFGSCGIIFKSHGKLTAKYIETIRLDIAKMLKKKAKVWLRICCDTPVTARPVETRMGKGKGAIAYWEAKVRPGQVFFEFSGLSSKNATQVLKKLQNKSALTLELISHRL